MRKEARWARAAAIAALLTGSTPLFADLYGTIGYTQLMAELGAALPDGTGVAVAQIEAADGNGNFSPYVNNSHFTGKTFTPGSGPAGTSTHAYTVGTIFYSNTASMASGVDQIKWFLADTWISADFLRTGEAAVPDYTTHNSRVANHSYVGELADPDTELYDRLATLEAVERIDWVIANDDFIQVVGGHNAAISLPLQMEAFNTIVVGRTGGSNTKVTSDKLENGSMNPYVESRIVPHLVSPSNLTSFATPRVASAVAMLIEVADTDPSLSLNRSRADATRANQTIYDAATSEVIKAVLMAGASRAAVVEFGDVYEPATVSALTPDPNGLDTDWGAGVLNIYNSYHILTAGETDSDQDDGAGFGAIDPNYGWDYDESFGDNELATYRFTATQSTDFLATLAWNVDIDIDLLTTGSPTPDSAATLYDLNLGLYDVTDVLDMLIAESSSTTQNTENLMTLLVSGRDYELRVSTLSSSFEWDYGLAWRTTAVPEPGGLLALMILSAGLVPRRRGRH